MTTPHDTFKVFGPDAVQWEKPKLTCPQCEKEVDYLEEVYDGHGIYIGRTCSDVCKKKLLSGFRSDIMESYDCDEPIDPEPTTWMGTPIHYSL